MKSAATRSGSASSQYAGRDCEAIHDTRTAIHKFLDCACHRIEVDPTISTSSWENQP